MLTVEQLIRAIKMEQACGPSRDPNPLVEPRDPACPTEGYRRLTGRSSATPEPIQETCHMADEPSRWIPAVRKINDAVLRAEHNRRDPGKEVMADLREMYRVDADSLGRCPAFQRPEEDPSWERYTRVVNEGIKAFREGGTRKKGSSLANWLHQQLVAAGLFDGPP